MDGEAVLPVLPWTSAALGLVLLVGLQVPVPRRPRTPVRSGGSPVGTAAGAVLLGLLLAALAAGARLLGDSELDNPASALVVGLGGPLLLGVPLLLSPLLRRRSGPADAPGDVRAAVPLTALLVLLLAGLPAPGRPGVLGPALSAYGVAVLAVGLAAGRGAAARAEPLGLLARWAALGPRLAAWDPPRGAATVLVLVLGGAWAERAARTAAWGDAAPGQAARLVLLGVAVALAAAVALPLRRHGAAAVLLPLAAAAVLAGGLRRALISAQLLADTASSADRAVVADPLGLAGGQLLALAAAALLGSAAAVVLARRAGEGADRLAGLAAVVAASAVTCLLVLQP